MAFGQLQATPHEIDVRHPCGDALGLFLLEHVEDIHGPLESNGVHRAIRRVVVILDQFEHARPSEPLQGLCRDRRVAMLHIKQLPAECTPDDGGKLTQVPQARRDEVNRLPRGIRHVT